MTCTQAHPCAVTTLGALVYCAVHHSAVAPKAIAAHLGCRYQYLLDAANPDRAEVAFQARLIVPLLRFTERTDLLQSFAAMAGGIYAPLPEGDFSLGTDDIVPLASCLTTALGQLLHELGDRVTPAMRQRAAMKCHELTAHCLRLSAALDPAREATSLRRSA